MSHASTLREGAVWRLALDECCQRVDNLLCIILEGSFNRRSRFDNSLDDDGVR